MDQSEAGNHAVFGGGRDALNALPGAHGHRQKKLRQEKQKTKQRRREEEREKGKTMKIFITFHRLCFPHLLESAP